MFANADEILPKLEALQKNVFDLVETNSPLLLRETILQRLNKEYISLPGDNEIIDLLYEKDHVRDVKPDDEPLGLYVPENIIPKVWLALERIIELAKKNNILEEALIKMVFLHEVGHHVFGFDGIEKKLRDKYYKDIFEELDEGMANYFVCLVAEKNIKAVLEKITPLQPVRYQRYKIFTEWAEVDQNTCFIAIKSLSEFNYINFFKEYFFYLLTKCTDENLRESWLPKTIKVLEDLVPTDTLSGLLVQTASIPDQFKLAAFLHEKDLKLFDQVITIVICDANGYNPRKAEEFAQISDKIREKIWGILHREFCNRIQLKKENINKSGDAKISDIKSFLLDPSQSEYDLKYFERIVEHIKWIESL